MENEGAKEPRTSETDFLVQWGNRKRQRCFKVKKSDIKQKSENTVVKRSTSRHLRVQNAPVLPVSRSNGCSDPTPNQSKKSPSPEKEDRCYTTRGTVFEEGGKLLMDGMGDDKAFVWPKFFISLSSKEKEEDFMAMKGCKLPQRPKKRAKGVQRSIFLVSPGAWLSDLSHERYEVREKKSSKRRPRGLKAMGGVDSDSD